jgi:hypothetical protein
MGKRVANRNGSSVSRSTLPSRLGPVILALLAVVSAVLFAFGGSAGAAGCEDKFTGASGGKWNVAGNWEKGLPTSKTIVCWPAGTTVLGEGVDTADSIQSGGTLETNGAEMTLADASNQSTIKNLTIDGGRLNGPGSLALTGNFLWTGPSAAFSNNAAMEITQTGGGSFAVEGSGQAYDQGGLISTTSPVLISDKDFIATDAHGTPTLATTSTVTFAEGEYTSNGGLRLEAAGIVTTGPTSAPAYDFHLTGDLSSLGGSLTGLSFSSEAGTTLTVPIGVRLAPNGGTIAGTVTGAGTYEQEGATTTIVKGATLSTADVEVPGGTLSIEQGATYDASAATTVKTGGQMEVGDSGKTGNLTLSPNGSTLGGGPSGGSLAVTGNFLWTGGSAELSQPNPLELTQTGGGEFKIEGSGQEYLTGGSINTSSPISITDPEFITTGDASVTTTGVLSFGEGLVVPENGGDSATFAAASVASNKGSSYGLGADSLVLTGPATTTVEAGHELQAGALIINGGTLADDGAVKPEVKVRGGTLSGSGTVLGAVQVQSGTVRPAVLPGKLTVDGIYQQEAAGTLEVEIESESAYSQLFDKESPRLEASSTVDVSDKGGFTPKAGQKFDVIATLHHPIGGFTTIGGPSGGLYKAVYGETFAALEGAETAPVNTALPQVSGTFAVGGTLTCSTGSWSPAPTSYSYQWNLDGSPIAGADGGNEFVVAASEAGHMVSCTVTARDEAGAGTPATSAGVSISVPVLVPVNTGPPSIAGTPAVGELLSCSTGTWANGPTGYSYQWYRGGVAIAGATGPTYTPAPADGGQTLTCAVSASDSAGASALVKSTGVAVPVPPPLLLSCSGKDIELVSVSVKGRSVLLAGIALKQFAGQRVTITLSDVSRRVAKGKGGATTVAADGTFHLQLPLPKGPTAPLTRYTATVAGHASLGLKLGRVLLITAEHDVANGLQVSFKGTGALAKGAHTIEIVQQVSCTKSAVFEREKLGPGAKLTVTLPAPTEAGAVAYYRAQTPTSAGPTYSLPIAVKQGA